MRRSLRALVLWLAAGPATLIAIPAAAFVPAERWSLTASGSTGTEGDPTTLTWSIVPDGTLIPGVGSSSLIAVFDREFGQGPGGSDLSQRPWFTHFAEGLGRWSELSGLTYVYEPNDDGVTHGSRPGRLGTRGDVRVGAGFVDGDSDTLAFNDLPNNGDMVLDTGDADFFANPSGRFRALRNVIAHEAGHGFGLLHVESSTDAFLMEPFISVRFDGPQLDDIRGVQRLYGDFFEKSNRGRGNDTIASATNLGEIPDGGSRAVGTDGGPNTVVSPLETDFVSIDDDSDIDFYSFTTSAPSRLDAVLSPLGSTFRQGVQNGIQSTFNATAISDLSLEILDSTGTSVLALADRSDEGGLETLSDFELPAAGEFFVRVRGTADNVQLYELELAIEHLAVETSADFDLDGDVDGDDFLAWQAAFGCTSGCAVDADGDDDTDADDFLLWQTAFGASPSGAQASTAVPEPQGVALGALALLTLASTQRMARGRSSGVFGVCC